MKNLILSCIVAWAGSTSLMSGPMDVAPFGTQLPEKNGVCWEDPREIHRVIVHFESAPPTPEQVKLEYWGSRWPDQRLPKDHQPGGGSVGWMELGNWYCGDWRVADAEAKAEGKTISFAFRPLNAREYTNITDYPAPFRYTLKIRVTSSATLPHIEKFEAFTDSVWQEKTAQVIFDKSPAKAVIFEAFNGTVEQAEKISANGFLLHLKTAANSDPNTFDRTIVTVRGKKVFSFDVDDLTNGPLVLPAFGARVLPGSVFAEPIAGHEKTLYDRVGELPEQTWPSAWAGVPRKKSSIVFPLGLDGGRQRFRLESDGHVAFRCNDHMLRNRPGKDTSRLDWEKPEGRLIFALPKQPIHRTIEEESLPICYTTWEVDGVRVEQTAFATALEGTQAAGPVPEPDTVAVFMARFSFTNSSAVPKQASLPFSFKIDKQDPVTLRFDAAGFFWVGERLRGQLLANRLSAAKPWAATLQPGETRTVLVKLPYFPLQGEKESNALANLDFETERKAVASYWRRRLNQSAELITPEPMLNEFYRAHPGHLLINCEREPGKEFRFARVGSFLYGAYGNESCMMVVDLDRRGYHKEAQECLDAWLHYQGTVGLPGDFSSQKGILYGAGGYEMGGYNQHHGWILWCLGEHYRFTRDDRWLRQAAPGIVAGADWIISETARTRNRADLSRGLLPAGSLEDIGDWWTWLSTSCYSWRGLDTAAWALEQIKHPDAKRIRKEADAYHTALLANFRAAAERSPVVRLRDGTAVPHIPSYVERRGRAFGWICETLEGSLHLLITRALDARSPDADCIIKDYEDNRYISNQYGYLLDNFDKYWFGRGGMSMQACLLFNPEPYFYRDDVKQALRAVFNAMAVSYFPDVRMNTEHALPQIDQWAGDHYKSSDESNAAGWLRQFFVREEKDELLVGQCVPRDWLKPEKKCGLLRGATWFGPMSILYQGGVGHITAQLDAPRRNPPKTIRLRFREPQERKLASVLVNGKSWKKFEGEWVQLPGTIGKATIVAKFE